MGFNVFTLAATDRRVGDKVVAVIVAPAAPGEVVKAKAAGVTGDKSRHVFAAAIRDLHGPGRSCIMTGPCDSGGNCPLALEQLDQFAAEQPVETEFLLRDFCERAREMAFEEIRIDGAGLVGDEGVSDHDPMRCPECDSLNLCPGAVELQAGEGEVHVTDCECRDCRAVWTLQLSAATALLSREGR
jgi:hypothetical protein